MTLIGLDYSEIGDYKNFFHINPQYFNFKGTGDKVQSDYNGSIDFLKSIDNDIPKGKLLFLAFTSNK